ncbi:MAG: hypothetical protein ABL928_06685 [Sphingorhabdus sp.]
MGKPLLQWVVEAVGPAFPYARAESAFPLMITTADNVLAEPAYLRGVHEASMAGEGEAVVVPHLTPDGAFTIDGDDERTYGVAELLLKQRKS